MFDWVRLLGVFSRARAPLAPSDPRCRTRKDLRATNGWVMDRFEPTKTTGNHLVLLHGWTLNGKNDPRLQAFAQSLAVAGTACVVPTLPGLADLAFRTADVEDLAAFLAEEGDGAGVLGFSLGGTYAVLSIRGIRPRVVISISGCGDLPALYDHWDKWGKKLPDKAAARDTWLYMKLVLAWRLRDVLGLTADELLQLRNLLLAYCAGAGRDAEWAFYERSLRRFDLETLDMQHQDPAVLQALSPTLHPPRVPCPVSILHDKNDEGMPACQAPAMAAAIEQGSPGIEVDVLVTALLSHVSPKIALRPGEILRLLHLLSPLISV